MTALASRSRNERGSDEHPTSLPAAGRESAVSLPDSEIQRQEGRCSTSGCFAGQLLEKTKASLSR